jgi:hypothetical protein
VLLCKTKESKLGTLQFLIVAVQIEKEYFPTTDRKLD